MPLSARIQAGKLRHRIQIVAPAAGGQDTFGGVPGGNMAVVKTTWAAIDGISAKDALAAGQFVSTATHKITVRFDKAISINASQSIWFKGRTFQIQGVLNPDERSKLLYIFCLEVNDSREQVASPNDGTTG